jgi:16S rRNA (cytosine967-C5)-methyltransferase
MTREAMMPAGAAERLAALGPETVRRVARVVGESRPADETLAALFRAHREYGARDRRFLSDLVFSYFRWLGWLRDVAPDAACAIAWFLDAERDHPAARILAEKAGLAELGREPALLAASSVPAKAIALQVRLHLPNPPSPFQLVPAWTAGALAIPPGAHPAEHRLHCIESFQRRPPTWLRAAREHERDLLDELRKAGIEVAPHPAVPEALSTPGWSPLAPLASRIGALYAIQDLSSQCVGLLCDARPGQRWWDVCAGAGGKSLHLADLMAGEGSILATDVRETSLRELRRRAAEAGVRCVRTRRVGPGIPGPRPGESFDGVLVDAPCSGVGTWARNPDARWRTSEDFVASRAAMQIALLEAAAPGVARGGALVYAVCTVTSAETLAVAERFVNTHPEFELDPAPHPLTGRPTDGRAWIWPWDGPCTGMFVARFKRSGAR